MGQKTSLDKLGKLAEEYVEVHTDYSQTPTRCTDSSGRQQQLVKCYQCGSSAHLLKDCPTVVKKTAPWPTPDRSCFVCGKTGHLARNCFQRHKTAALKDDTDSDEVSCECFQRRASNSNTCNALMAPEVQLKCGCKLLVIADACQNDSALRMPVKSGSFSGKVGVRGGYWGCSSVSSGTWKSSTFRNTNWREEDVRIDWRHSTSDFSCSDRNRHTVLRDL